jgi:hypothetical protein
MCRLSCRWLDYLHDWQKKMEGVIDIFLITKGNVQFLDVFCIFQCQQNKGFSHFLDTDSKLTVYRDGVVRPSRKDNILLPVVFDEFSAMP